MISQTTGQRPTEPLRIPDIPEDADNLTAALLYAQAGLYVLPTKSDDIKNPGSRVGKGWPQQSSRDPEMIIAWFAGTDDGIAIDLGRSGLAVIDSDHPELQPGWLATALAESGAPYQSTRPDTPGRGHYVFAQPPGRRIGCGKGALAGMGLDVKGDGGVIIVTPTKHPEEGGCYGWVRTGQIPVMPEVITGKLADTADRKSAATDTEVAMFKAEYREETAPQKLTAWEAHWDNAIDAHDSRHETMIALSPWAYEEVRLGFVSATTASDWMRQVFVDAKTQTYNGSAPKSERAANAEYDGIEAWGISQAMSHPIEKLRERRCGQALPASARPDEEVTFWNERPVLKRILEFAEAQLVSPWGVLGVALVRTVCMIPPIVKLPAITGGEMSLNMFCATTGASGEGKGGVEHVAREAIHYHDPKGNLLTVCERNIGSGEGLVKAFRQTPSTDDRPTAICFSEPEIDTLASIFVRSGSTAESVLRKMFSGERLGFENAHKETKSMLAAHSYRAGLIVGVQPLRGDVLLNSKDGGTPQRFIWAPVHDLYAPEDDREPPAPWKVTLPKSWYSPIIVDDEIRAQIRETRRKVLRRDPSMDSLDKHRALTRLKVAAALVVLSGNVKPSGLISITLDDWRLAEVIMRKSDTTRDEVANASETRLRGVIRARALAKMESGDIEAEGRIAKAKSGILAQIAKLRETDLLSLGELKRRLRSDLRDDSDPAIYQLLCDNKIRVVEAKNGESYGRV